MAMFLTQVHYNSEEHYVTEALTRPVHIWGIRIP